MLILPPPDLPPSAPPAIAQTLAVSQVTGMDLSSYTGEMGSCMVSPTASRLAGASSIASLEGTPMFPEATALRWFPDAKTNLDLQAAAEAAPVQIVRPAAHGTVTFSKTGGGFQYRPTAGYAGNDMVVFMVDIDGRRIKVTSFVKVVGTRVTTDNLYGLIRKYCPRGSDWRIEERRTDRSNLAPVVFGSGSVSIAEPYVLGPLSAGPLAEKPRGP